MRNLNSAVDFSQFLQCNSNSNHLGQLFMLLRLALLSRLYFSFVLFIYYCFLELVNNNNNRAAEFSN